MLNVGLQISLMFNDIFEKKNPGKKPKKKLHNLKLKLNFPATMRQFSEIPTQFTLEKGQILDMEFYLDSHIRPFTCMN